MKTLQIYVDPTNRTICVRGDLDLTHWAVLDGDEEFDAIVTSGGTVIRFRFEEDRCLLGVVDHGQSLMTTIPGVDEIGLEGDIKWVLVGWVTEFARVPQ